MFSKGKLLSRFDAVEVLMLTAGVVFVVAILFSF